MNLEVYADGSAQSEGSPGGYGWVLVANGVKIEEGNGYMPSASNNDAELEAAIQGLAAAFRYSHKQCHILGDGPVARLASAHEVTLISDSQIVLNWANGTYRFKQLDKINKYNSLMKLVKLMNVQTRWVKGHAGDIHNERCDRLANAGRLQTDVEAPKTKKSKIGKKTEGVFLFSYKGIKKIVDFSNDRCETYSVDHAPIEELTVIRDINE